MSAHRVPPSYVANELNHFHMAETERLHRMVIPLSVIYASVVCFISLSYYFGSLPYLDREYHKVIMMLGEDMTPRQGVGAAEDEIVCTLHMEGSRGSLWNKAQGMSE
jgi:hypothetical protein